MENKQKQVNWKDAIYIATLLISISIAFITVKIQANQNAKDIAEIKSSIKDYNVLVYKVDKLNEKMDLFITMFSDFAKDNKSGAR